MTCTIRGAVRAALGTPAVAGSTDDIERQCTMATPFSSSLAVGAGRDLVWKLDDTDELPPLLSGPTTPRGSGPPRCTEHRRPHHPRGGAALRVHHYLRQRRRGRNGHVPRHSGACAP